VGFIYEVNMWIHKVYLGTVFLILNLSRIGEDTGRGKKDEVESTCCILEWEFSWFIDHNLGTVKCCYVLWSNL
jgi:hypothetical protein